MARRGENIYKRKDGRWEGRYKSGYRADGTAKYSSVYGKTYASVKTVLNKRRAAPIGISTPYNLTVGNLFDLWLKYIRVQVKESTYINYLMKCEKHILPLLEHIRYEKLTVNNLNEFINKKTEEGLSAKYVADIAGVVKSVCRFAHKQYGYADKSECMVFPKKERGAEKPMLEKKEQKILEEYLLGDPSASNVGILLASYTGLRIGELCALKWSDIDLEKRVIMVRYTMQRIRNIDGESMTKLVLTSPKSQSSVREIPLPKFMADLLRDLKSSCNSYLLSGTEKITEPRTMQYRFKSLLKKLKLSTVSFHSLRHMFATNCIELGFDVKTLSEILGHSSVEITLNRYVHSSIKRKVRCMELLSIYFTANERDYLPSDIPSQDQDVRIIFDN